MPDISDFAILAGAMKLAYAMLGIIMLVYVSRWLDARAARALAREDVNGFGAALRLIRTNAIAAAIYQGARFLTLGILLAALMGCAPAVAGPAFPTRYDGAIKSAAAKWWPAGPSWKAWKAQLYQESRLDPAAVSPVGAAGLAQFMPGTWGEVRRELRFGALSPNHEIAIEAGAYYMAKLSRAWSAPRPALDRHRLAQASYNAGTGNLLKAQARCGGPPLYADIVACLPAVTGEHSRETLTYVERIARYWALLEAGA